MASKPLIPSRPFRVARREEDVTSTTAEGDARYFLKWFTTNRFALIESFLHQLDHAPDTGDRRVLKRRYLRAVRHAKRVMVLRLAVTVLVLLAAPTVAASSLVSYLDVLPGAEILVNRVATVAASAFVLLLAARFAVDRHLERVQLYLIFTGMQIAGRRAPGTGDVTDETPGARAVAPHG